MEVGKQSVTDVIRTLTYLTFVVLRVKGADPDQDPERTFGYARSVLRGAEKPLRKLAMYETVEHAIDECQRLILASQFDEAFRAADETLGELMEKSGMSARLRKLYPPKKTPPMN